MIESVIFDMDGLLIDSEPLWQEAEIELFKSVGIELTPDLCRQTTGLGINDAIKYWYEKYPWQDVDIEELKSEISILSKHHANPIGSFWENI